jgi:hypothetical protein
MPLVLDGTTGFSGGGGVATSTALGSSALFTNSTGTNLVAIGYQAGYFTTAGPNVFVGSQAGYTNSTGTSNIGIGYQALYLNSTGSNNLAIGYQAGYSNTTGDIEAFGYQALYANTTGIRLTAVGYSALGANSTGGYNTAVGFQALALNTTATENSSLGYQAGYSNTTGTENVSIGSSASYTSTTATANTAVGRRALYANTVSNNTAVGHSALAANTTGNFNVAVGSAAFPSVTTGAGNTAVGEGAGGTLATNNNCTFLGQRGLASGSAVQHEIVIGCNTTGKGSNTGFINPNSGGVYQGNNSGTWSTTSDRRLKKNIVDNTEGLNIVSQIRVRNFEYRLENEVTELPLHTVIKKEGLQLGVIAQELQEVCPDCVKTESTGVLSVDSDNLTWHMINAIKELKTLVDAQAALITGQSAEIVALKAKVGL